MITGSGEREMKFKQFYLGCLSHASYYLGSEGDAAVIDPQRDVQQYIDEADANGQKIKYVIETHSHADFVSGHIELAERTGAEIVYGSRANTHFPTLKVNDGDELSVGKIKLSFLETPGHTPEGITILADDGQGPVKMFTGDTLFIGDVGRPDLIGSKGFTPEQMGAMLFDSLHNKILPLADETEVYPAHGAGSLCGRSLSKETWSTLGEQRKFNYALQPMSKEEFVKLVAADQPEVPMYFQKSAAKNLEGSVSLTDLPKPKALTFDELNEFEGIVLDVRPAAEYGAGHIKNSINIGLGGQFASWAGTMMPIGVPLVIAADAQEQIDEAFMRLARVGHDTVTGYFLMSDHSYERQTVRQVTVNEAKEATGDAGVQFIDVRRAAEHAGGHAPGTINLPLDSLTKNLDGLNPDTPTYVICQGGYRSSLATSILENADFKEIYNVTGGTGKWIETGLETETTAAACAVK